MGQFSKRLTKKQKDKLEVTGNLTLHGITKEITVEMDPIRSTITGMDIL